MNKSDIKLIIIVIVILLLFFIIKYFTKEEGSTFQVYYDNILVLEESLNINKEYTVEGFLGDVTIEVKDKKVRVVKENSPRHICSREGYISDSSKPLICLPNKIVIKISNKDNSIDEVVY